MTVTAPQNGTTIGE